jgi:hypothetical protein
MQRSNGAAPRGPGAIELTPLAPPTDCTDETLDVEPATGEQRTFDIGVSA